MSSRLRILANAFVLFASTSLAACAPPPPPPEPPKSMPKAAKDEPPPPPPAEPEPTASASAQAPAPEPEPTAPKSSGRTPLLKTDPEEITDTFGSPPAKLELGDPEKAILRIPENAFSEGVNITFKIEKKGNSGGSQVGKIYRITPVIPPADKPTKVSSAGPPFELMLPAGNKADANLAIGEIVTDEKGRAKVVWTVIAPLKIDDVTSMARYELPALSDAYLHVTTRAVTSPKE